MKQFGAIESWIRIPCDTSHISPPETLCSERMPFERLRIPQTKTRRPCDRP